MKSQTLRIVGWIMSVLLAAFLIFSAVGKFVAWEGKSEMLNHLGYSPEVMVKIGVVEVIIAVLFLIPRTGFLGSVLLTGYLGGATATHVRVGDPFVFPIVAGVVMWLIYGLRRPELFRLAMGSAAPAHPAESRSAGEPAAYDEAATFPAPAGSKSPCLPGQSES